MTEKISLLVPTRGRLQMCASMWLSAWKTAEHRDNLELVVYIDIDDPKAELYTDWLTQQVALRRNVFSIVGKRIILSETWNRLAEHASGDILWHGNDDVIFQSNHWDTLIRNAFEAVPDRIALVHGRDGIHDAAQATLGFLHRRWMETVGYFVPPYFSSDYNDTWLTDVANQLHRRMFVPGVYTEHLHPAVGKGKMDQTHQDRLTRHRQDNVDALYEQLADERTAWAEKLRAVMM